MKINRYTRVQPAKYDPMSMQELLMVPTAKRQQHDASVAYAQQMGMFDVDALDVDKKHFQDKISEYEGGVNQYIEQLSKEGVNGNTTQGLLQLAKGRKKLEEGYLNPAAQTKAAMQKYREDIMSDSNVKDWGAGNAQLWADQQINRFVQEGGTFQNGKARGFNGQFLPKYVDANKRLDEAIDKVKSSQAESLMQKYGIEGVNELHTFMASSKVDHLDKEKIINAIQTELAGDTNFQKSYMTEAALNGEQGNPFDFGSFEKDAEGRYQYKVNNKSSLDMMIYGKAMGAEFTKESKQFSKIAAAKSALEAADGDVTGTYHVAPAEHKEVFRQSLFEQLNNVASEATYKKESRLKTSPSYDASYGLMGNSEVEEGVEEPWSFEHLDADNKEHYTNIFNKLKENEYLTEDATLEDIESFKQVRNYLKPFMDVAVENVEIDPFTASTTEHQGINLIHKDANKAKAKLKDDILYGRRVIWNKETGERVEVPEDFFENADYSYLGYVTANNQLEKLKGANPDQLVMPHIMGHNGTQYYVERTKAEREGGSFKAARTLKHAYNKGIMEPMLPIEHPVDDTMKGLGISSFETAYNPIDKTMTVKMWIQADEGKLGGREVKYENLPLDLFNLQMSELYTKFDKDFNK